MMFLFKTVFWLGLVLVLLPTGSNKQPTNVPQVNAAEATTAATQAVADLSQFCTRRPDSCAVGSQVATILARRAQEGAIMVYEFITERGEAPANKGGIVQVRHNVAATAGHADTTGSIARHGAPAVIPAVMIPRPRPSLPGDTLTAVDRRPSWRTPELRQEARLKHPG